MISLFALFEDNLSGLFTDHVHRTGNKKARNARKDRRIHYPQPFHAAHAKITCKYFANRARARRVMSPCVGTDEFPQFRITGQMIAGQFFFGDEALVL